MTDPLDGLFDRIIKANTAFSRPFVTLTYAQSLDGSIAFRQGQPLALSGPDSLTMTHRLRAAHDAILVGIGTVLADDPQLSVRRAEGDSPQPVILDTQLRFPLRSKLLRRSPSPWIAASESASPNRAARLEAAGAVIVRLPRDKHGCLCLAALLERLANWGVSRLMVEGGTQVITSFLASQLVDLIVVTVSPRLLGGLPAVRDLGLSDPILIPRIERPSWHVIGTDFVVWGGLEWGRT